MKAVGCFETSVSDYYVTQCRVPEEGNTDFYIYLWWS